MSLEKKKFYGKEVTDAIKKACDEFGVAQEKLDIEVVETGSTGIFGLIRKKAYIKAALKTVAVEEEVAKEVGVAVIFGGGSSGGDSGGFSGGGGGFDGGGSSDDF